jgi:hypothetical protein
MPSLGGVAGLRCGSRDLEGSTKQVRHSEFGAKTMWGMEKSANPGDRRRFVT